ncbi:MAG: Glu-tRNA(Gln) amidotransferase subunit GatE [Planctomycetota bacterium]
MDSIDYSNIKFYEGLGFKCGVEIHQQLLTKKKLFCNCPAGRYSKIHDAEILRHMRPTLSELGEYDGCALMEFKTKKEVIYQLNRESVCTYEMDDTPPFMVNQEGLDIAIEIALMLNCSIVDEMHISRKQYLDGSIPTGFQRTAVVGINGWIPYKNRKIRISHICYEEDACREVSDISHQIIFKTDRLGMPLIEVITCADIRTPQEAGEVVIEIGRLMRATGKVRRGIGSVRQDVNASIAGGSRVEIKGVPQIGWISALLHNESLRQHSLLDIKQILVQRNITENNINVLKTDSTKVLSKTKSEIMKNNLARGNVIGGIKICGIAGLFNHQTQPTKTFADEIAGRIRVIACLDIMPNFLHTDNYPTYAGSNDDLYLIRKFLQISNDDVGVIVWGSKQDVTTALEEIRLRIIDAIRGIPNETRQPFRSGLTDFERILPGPNRMYPDTDSPPTTITKERITKVQQNLPDAPWQREKRYIELGINYVIARELAISAKASLADKILADTKINPILVGVVMTQGLKALRRKDVDVNKITDESLFELFELYSKGMFCKEIIIPLIEKLTKDNSLGIKDIITKDNLSVIPEEKLDTIINQTIKENQFKAFTDDKKDLLRKMTDFYAGKVMKKYKGRINGQVLRTILEQKSLKTS